MLVAISGDILDMREMARRFGLISIVMDGLKKAQEGLTTLEELRWVVPLEQTRSSVQYELKQKQEGDNAVLA
jgi:hypothetical protein